MKSKNGKTKTKGIVIIGTTLALVFAVYSAFYAWYVYPDLPVTLGGGRPIPAVIWVKNDSVPTDITTALPGVHFSALQGGITRSEHVFILYHDAQVVIVTDHDYAPSQALILRRDSVIAIRAPKP